MDDEKRALLAKKRYVLVLVHTDMKRKDTREKYLFFDVIIIILRGMEWDVHMRAGRPLS